MTATNKEKILARQPPNAWFTGLQRRTAALLVSHRRIALLAIVALVLAVETIEHLIIHRFGNTAHLWYDILVYMPLIPAGLWLLLSLLKSAATEREQAAVDNDMRVAFSQRLGDAGNWNDLVRQMVEFPHQLAPGARVTLFLYHDAMGRMEPEVSCQPDGTITFKPVTTINPDSLPVGSLPQLLIQSSSAAPFPRPEVYPPRAPLPPHRYDLPLVRSDEALGVLKLEYPPGRSAGKAEVSALKAVAPTMALALEVGLLQRLSAVQAAASEAQRQRIAQNLHDTLAQNINFLRLKLDQLIGENAIHEIGMVLQELEHMRATADEAYQQVRNTLDDLAPVQGEDPANILVKQAQTIAERAKFTLSSSQSGQAFNLPAATRQHILYVMREALHNVEKHAQATQVQLMILWLANELIIKVTDNGAGFDMHAIQPDGHYGLWIMQHRAQEVGGTLKIDTSPGNGTEVTLWIPRVFHHPVSKAYSPD